MELTVNLGKNSYPILIEDGILTHAGTHIAKIFGGEKIMIISDDNVFSTLWKGTSCFPVRL